jgi:endonuclease-3
LISLYRQKAKYLRGVGRACVELDGDIPTDIKGLTALPGIGPKMGYLTLSSAWGKVDGIGVDTHVHRISNRLRWVKSKDAEGTRAQLERWLPKDLWADVNLQLVGFGQMVCKDTPKCNRCLVGYVGACPSATVKPAPDAGALRERLQGMLDGGDAAALAQWVRERVDRQREEEEEAPTSKKSKK